jgi:hypothetical protein
MEAPQPLYNQAATRFELRFFLRRDAVVEGSVIAHLAECFLGDLLLPGARPTTLVTRRPGLEAKLNMGEFAQARWKASRTKILAGDYGVLGLDVAVPDFPNRRASLSILANPAGWTGPRLSGALTFACSVSYLRSLAASPEKVEALLRLGRSAWNGIDGGPAYGFGNLALTPKRPEVRFGADGRVRLAEPPAERPHAIPVASVGPDIDGNLELLFGSGKGIKGAFWANFLSSASVGMACGETQLRAKLPGMRVEPLDHGGLLIVATESPLPDDTEENRARFLQLHAALQPAFLSREETVESKRALLGYFYRERDSILP